MGLEAARNWNMVALGQGWPDKLKTQCAAVTGVFNLIRVAEQVPSNLVCHRRRPISFDTSNYGKEIFSSALRSESEYS